MVVFEAGDVILEEKAFVAVLDHSQKQQRCDFCFEKNDQLKRCAGCKQMFYCSRECQLADWRRAHKLTECHVYQLSEKLEHTVGANGLSNCIANYGTARLLLRLHLIVQYKPQRLEKQKLTPLGTYRCLADLMEHSDQMLNHKLRMQIFDQLTQMYERVHVKFDKDSLFSLFCKMYTNGFSIMSPIMAEIGRAVYVLASLFDHSCTPNAVTVFHGQRIQVRAMSRIDTSMMPVLVSYLNVMENLDKRQQMLSDHYFFKCKCARCLFEEGLEGKVTTPAAVSQQNGLVASSTPPAVESSAATGDMDRSGTQGGQKGRNAADKHKQQESGKESDKESDKENNQPKQPKQLKQQTDVIKSSSKKQKTTQGETKDKQLSTSTGKAAAGNELTNGRTNRQSPKRTPDAISANHSQQKDKNGKKGKKEDKLPDSAPFASAKAEEDKLPEPKKKNKKMKMTMESQTAKDAKAQTAVDKPPQQPAAAELTANQKVAKDCCLSQKPVLSEKVEQQVRSTTSKTTTTTTTTMTTTDATDAGMNSPSAAAKGSEAAAEDEWHELKKHRNRKTKKQLQQLQQQSQADAEQELDLQKLKSASAAAAVEAETAPSAGPTEAAPAAAVATKKARNLNGIRITMDFDLEASKEQVDAFAVRIGKLSKAQVELYKSHQLINRRFTAEVIERNWLKAIKSGEQLLECYRLYYADDPNPEITLHLVQLLQIQRNILRERFTLKHEKVRELFNHLRKVILITHGKEHPLYASEYVDLCQYLNQPY